MGRPVEQINAQGLVVRRIDPEGDREGAPREGSRARREKREEESAARETARRNRALLATYTSEKDIEDARAAARWPRHERRRRKSRSASTPCVSRSAG